MCVCVCVYIQGDSGGICNILGNDSLCDSKQKSSYVHWSDFERLPKYGVVYVCIYIYIYIYIYICGLGYVVHFRYPNTGLL